jgi:hypothetical protein
MIEFENGSVHLTRHDAFVIIRQPVRIEPPQEDRYVRATLMARGEIWGYR